MMSCWWLYDVDESTSLISSITLAGHKVRNNKNRLAVSIIVEHGEVGVSE